jgi:hypothetical protein
MSEFHELNPQNQKNDGNPKGDPSPNGFVLKLNGENYTTYDDLLRHFQFITRLMLRSLYTSTSFQRNPVYVEVMSQCFPGCQVGFARHTFYMLECEANFLTI